MPAVTLRIGIGLFTGQVPAGSDRTFAKEYRDTLELVRLAEALGFDSAWVSEHHGASDGYLPFPDNVREAERHGVGFIVHPGGSTRDDLAAEACRDLGIALVTTGVRVFHH